MTEAELLAQVKWLLTLLEKRLPAFTWTRVHVMPVLRGRRPCQCHYVDADGCEAEIEVVREQVPILSKNSDMEGFSDVEVVHRGLVGYIELKATRGRLRESQEAFRDRVTRAQAKYHQARTLWSVADFLCRDLEVPVGSIIKIPQPGNDCGGGRGDHSARGVQVPPLVQGREDQQQLDLGDRGGAEEVRRHHEPGGHEPGCEHEGDPGPD